MKNVRKGNLFVHTHHGVMRVRDISKQDGPAGVATHAVMDQVVREGNGHTGAGPLTLTIPVDNIEYAGLRRPALKDDIEDALALLSEIPTGAEPSVWSRRMTNYEKRLQSEDVFGAVQVLRSLHWRQLRNGVLSSSAERAMKERAHWRVVAEIAASQHCSIDLADQRVRQSMDDLADVL